MRFSPTVSGLVVCNSGVSRMPPRTPASHPYVNMEEAVLTDCDIQPLTFENHLGSARGSLVHRAWGRIQNPAGHKEEDG